MSSQMESFRSISVRLNTDQLRIYLQYIRCLRHASQQKLGNTANKTRYSWISERTVGKNLCLLTDSLPRWLVQIKLFTCKKWKSRFMSSSSAQGLSIEEELRIFPSPRTYMTARRPRVRARTSTEETLENFSKSSSLYRGKSLKFFQIPEHI